MKFVFRETPYSLFDPELARLFGESFCISVDMRRSTILAALASPKFYWTACATSVAHSLMETDLPILSFERLWTQFSFRHAYAMLVLSSLSAASVAGRMSEAHLVTIAAIAEERVESVLLKMSTILSLSSRWAVLSAVLRSADGDCVAIFETPPGCFMQRKLVFTPSRILACPSQPIQVDLFL